MSLAITRARALMEKDALSRPDASAIYGCSRPLITLDEGYECNSVYAPSRIPPKQMQTHCEHL